MKISSCKAQYVDIPDSSFAAYLHSIVPSAMWGFHLNITSSSLSQITEMDCSNLDIKSLEGLQYFDSLKELTCYRNEIAYIPPLPSKLEYLSCFNNRLDSLPALPNTIKTLLCDGNYLTYLPVLPNTLIELQCNDNLLTELPVIPASLRYLWCKNNQLQTLPKLPLNLEVLRCDNNELTTLPMLPASLVALSCAINKLDSLPPIPGSVKQLFCSRNSLTSIFFSASSELLLLHCTHNLIDSFHTLPSTLENLYCSSNRLITLPTLPSSLITLECDTNRLQSLPTLPETLGRLKCSANSIDSFINLSASLRSLHCSNNRLKKLPALPNTLRELFCSNNQLINLPPLPNELRYLFCSNNNLSEIPQLPINLSDFDCSSNPSLRCLPNFTRDAFNIFSISNTNISCLPKPISVAQSDGSEHIPICDFTSECPITFSINGQVYHDTTNCSFSGTKGSGVPLFKVLQYSDGALSRQTYTNSEGVYGFLADSNTAIRLQTESMESIKVNCPYQSYRDLSPSVSSSYHQDQDFGLECWGKDVKVGMIQGDFKTNTTTPVYIKAGDITNRYTMNCASGFSGYLTTRIVGDVTYVSPLPGALTPASISGNVLTYNISNFSEIDYDSAFNILVSTDSEASGEICIEVIIYAKKEWQTVYDTLIFCKALSSNANTNRKEAYPRERTSPDDWITYTLYYQNTSSDTVNNVFIRDTLSSHFDESTFTYLGGSVTPEIHISQKAILFNLPKIKLPDSATNDAESRGWLQYKVKTKANLLYDDSVENTAYIYLDRYKPVVTNTTINYYVESAATINEKRLQHIFKVYPNPTTGNITISFDKNHAQIRASVFTTTGQEVYVQTSSNTQELQFDFDAETGFYFLEIQTENGAKSVMKIVKK